MSTIADREAPVVLTVPPAPLAGPTPIPVEALRAVPGPAARTRAVFASYFALTKPRIVELLLVTTVPAMFLARQRLSPLWLTLVVLVGGAFAAGAANAVNCFIDRDIDQVMKRTSRRPLPRHRVSPRGALVFGLALAIGSLALFAVFTNWLATGLTAVAIVYYDVVYTLWLKRRTSQNTFWGGICGALPVLIGWAAVTGSLSVPAVLLFGIVFFWQLPHFYALAIKFKDDYARAGIPMLPVVRSLRRVGTETVVYAWLTLATSLALWPFGMTPLYGAAAVVLGALFVLEAHRLDRRIRRGEQILPMRLFHWSTTYLTLLFAAVAVDALIQ